MSVRKNLHYDYQMDDGRGHSCTSSSKSVHPIPDTDIPWDDLIVVDEISASDSLSQVGLNTDIQTKEKHRKSELEARIDILKQKQKLEQAKIKIQQEEELLALKMESALVNTKLDDHIVSLPIATSSPKVPAVKSKDKDTVRHSASMMTTEEMMLTVVKELRKPKGDIKKFAGDVMTYKKFIRQFNYISETLDNTNEKMNLLEQYTLGEANRIVSGYSHLDSQYGFPAAIEELEKRYGDDKFIASAYSKRALEWPSIRPDKPKDLDNFAIFLTEIDKAVNNIQSIKILEYPANMTKLVQKLPYYMHEKFRNFVDRIYDDDQPVTFGDLVRFVKREAKKANDPIYGREALSVKTPQHHKPVTRPKQHPFSSFAGQHFSEPNVTEKTPCIFCKKDNHALLKCNDFIKIPCTDRKAFIKSYHLCYGCLKLGHGITTCRRKAVCNICDRRHPTILHDVEFDESHRNPQQSKACSLHTEAGFCTMNIHPVLVRMKNSARAFETYAFFDSGSSVTFCTTKLMEQLGISGSMKRISLKTMGKPCSLQTFILHNLEVLDLNGNNVVPLPTVYTKDEMPVTKESIPTQADIKKWEHLQTIKIPEIDADIGLLIGNNIPDAYTPLEVISGPSCSPHASRTKLGWSVWNVIRELSANQVQNNTIRVNRCEVNVINETEQLEQLVHKAINMDFPEKLTEDKKENSVEDKRFLDKINSTITYTNNGHYQISLPFRSNDIIFPDNRLQAEQSLKYLQKKLSKNPQFREDYTKFMEDMITKEFAVKVPEEDLNKDSGRIWYLLHHACYHPRKKKIRVVFDLSAKFHGISLNQMLLSGPDLTSKLISVLLRFRLEPIAIIADITSMYYMVYVADEDTDFLRFLWYPNGDIDKPPIVYKMLVHIFGATSSPSCAISALQRTARDFKTDLNTEAVQTILKNFYVDDCLKSVPTEEEAITLVNDLINICNNGGFRLSKWMSNSRKVLEKIPIEDQAKELRNLNLDFDDLPTETALGVYWSAENDSLGFKINIQQKPATKRGILSTICSVYDPLGLAAPLILPAKIILQNKCQLHLQWDEDIPANLLQKWNQWLCQLPNLENVSIPRCYKPKDFGRIISCQIHSFSDASESGYGSAIYLRQVNEYNQIHCSLVLGKSRVSPLKRITIPRMELTAAVTSIRLSKMVMADLEFKLTENDIFYWTDSQSVLRYIANTTTRFQTFVTNRIEIIRELSELSQWRYVDSKSNIADDFSRGKTCTSNMKWLTGPDFLWQPVTEWPSINISLILPENDNEVKNTQLLIAVTDINKDNIMNRLFEYPSTWLKLKKTVAWILIGMKNLQNRIKRKHQTDSKEPISQPNNKMNEITSLSVESLKEAERRILIYVQNHHFSSEIIKLKRFLNLNKDSTILKLDPYLQDDLLRVGGRLQRSNLLDDMKHPILLPKDSRVSQLILEDIHRRVGHLGRNSMLAKLRETYWIVKAGTAIKNLVSKCIICRHYRSKVGEQKMANLPTDRLIADEPVFTVTGVDYFGPYEIKQGCSIVKRYGVVFTCLRTRAVHIEMAYSLDTDACINAIRRFTNRRGPVRVFKSDNGSNFISSNRELKEEFKKIDKIQHLLLNDFIKWEFNPPTASHFGGIWERQIRTIRKILFALLKEQTVRLSDDLLQTLFSEIENIINSRPITRNSEDPNDLSVLTPNNLLLFNNSGSFPLGTFEKTDNFVKRKWRQVQYISDIFWKRWSTEYLQSLQERQKWFLPKRNFEINDIVLLVDNTVSRNSWCLGKIIEIIKDKNNFVRTVKVKSKNSVFERPITKLCLLLEADVL